MTSTGVRLLAWVRRHAVLIVATVVTVAFVSTMAMLTFRLYDQRRYALAAVAEQARMNRMLNHDLCEGLNGANETLRNLLDASVRRITAASLTADQLRLTIDTYRRLPSTDCETGAKTYYDPPFPN